VTELLLHFNELNKCS